MKRGPAGLIALVRAIWRFGPSVAITSVVFPRWRTGLWSLFSGAGKRVCEGGGPFCNCPVAHSERHIVMRNLALLRPLGIEAGRPEYPGPLAPATRTPAEMGYDRIALFPGAGHPYRRWPKGCFIDVGRRLAQQHEIIVLTGPLEQGLGREVAGAIGGRTRLVNAPLREKLAELKSCRLYIGADTGLTHAAAAMGVPTIALLGPADPGEYGPLGPRVAIVRRQPPCAPCYRGGNKYNCPYPVRQCLDGITIKQVLAAANGMLAGSS